MNSALFIFFVHALAAGAEPAPKGVVYDELDLAAGRITVPLAKSATVASISGFACAPGEMTIRKGVLERGKSACSFWSQERPANATLHYQADGNASLDLQGAPRSSDGELTATYLEKDGVLELSQEFPKDTRLAIYLSLAKNSAWVLATFRAKGKTAALPADAFIKPRLRTAAGEHQALTMISDHTRGGDPAGPGSRPSFKVTLGTPDDKAARTEERRHEPLARFPCAEAVKTFREVDHLDFDKWVCIDSLGDSGNTPLLVEMSPSSVVVPPNTTTLVFVRHSPDAEVEISMDGNPGLFVPTVHRGTVQSKVPWEVAHKLFMPRLPGTANIHVTVNKVSATFELTVETTYVGAIRLGVAPVFLDAVDRKYAVNKFPGSQISEITRASDAVTDFELVLGYAAFFEGLTTIGRSYHQNSTHVAPFFGIGVISTGKGEVQAFKSLHLGAEYEFTPNFSIALTFVMRRVDRLADGAHVGAPVADAAAVPTTSRVGFGLGIVFNVSPEFFRFGTLPSIGL